MTGNDQGGGGGPVAGAVIQPPAVFMGLYKPPPQGVLGDAPSRSSPSIPRDLDSIILRCLALDPRSRYSSGGELLTALEALGPARPVRSPPGASTMTIGREAELARIDRLLDRLARRAPGPRAILITGGHPSSPSTGTSPSPTRSSATSRPPAARSRKGRG